MAGDLMANPEARACLVCGEPVTVPNRRVVTCSERCRIKRKNDGIAERQREVRKEARERAALGLQEPPARKSRRALLAGALLQGGGLAAADEDGDGPAASLEAPPPCPASGVPGVPWACSALCAAVRLGTETPSACKLGVFYVLQPRRGEYAVYLPSRENGPPDGGRGKAALIARATDGRIWRLRTPDRDAKGEVR